MCDCNDVFMINFKLFLQNRSIYSKYLFVSKTYILPLRGTSTGERVILLLRGSLAVAFNQIVAVSLSRRSVGHALACGGSLLVAVLLLVN